MAVPNPKLCSIAQPPRAFGPNHLVRPHFWRQERNSEHGPLSLFVTEFVTDSGQPDAYLCLNSDRITRKLKVIGGEPPRPLEVRLLTSCLSTNVMYARVC